MFFLMQNALIGGDYNADCSYLSAAEWQNLDMVVDPQFTWLIDSNADTTVSNTDCAYDR